MATERTKLIPYNQKLSIDQRCDSLDDDGISKKWNHESNSDNFCRLKFKKQIKLYDAMILSSLLVVLTLVYIIASPEIIMHPKVHHDHTIPSVLSVRTLLLDDDNNNNNSNNNNNNSGQTSSPQLKFADAMDNPLYNDFQNAKIIYNSSSSTTTTTSWQLTTDKLQLKFHDDITLSWHRPNTTIQDSTRQESNNNYNNHSSTLFDFQTQDPTLDSHIIALYCPATETDPRKFRDLASLSQIVITNHVNVLETKARQSSTSVNNNDDFDIHNTLDWLPHLNQNLDQGSWYIPSFPLIREDTCEFRLWIRQQEPSNTDTSISTATSHHSSRFLRNVTPNKLSHGSKKSYHRRNHYLHIPSSPQSLSESSISNYIYAGSSNTFEITHGRKMPSTIHLALTNKSNEMLVHFSTSNDDDVVGIPVVLYSTDSHLVHSAMTFPQNDDTNTSNSSDSSSNLLQMATGTSTTYQATDLCEAPANIEQTGKFLNPGMQHSIIMNNLLPDTEYHYKVGIYITSDSHHHHHDANINESLENSIIWSNVYSFHSPIPTTGDLPLSKPFTFLAYADQGCPGYGWRDGGDRTARWTEREIKDYNIRSVHHFGDLSYAIGSGHMWDAWLDMVSIFSASVPLMVGVGNHEYDHMSGGIGENGVLRDPSGLHSESGFMPSWGDFHADSNGECAVPVAKRFVMPSNGNGVFWYSFDYGNVHTIMISSEHDLSVNSQQYSWLLHDLQHVNRAATPWIIIESHRPMYNVEDIAENTLVGINMRNEFEHLLHQYNVDLFLAGHYHAYFRSCPGLYQSKCNNGGPTHITVGTAGAELDSAPLLRESWSGEFIAEWGYGRITVFNNTALHWEFVTDNDGLVKDDFWILKN